MSGRSKKKSQQHSNVASQELKNNVNSLLSHIGDGQGLPDMCLDENNHCMLLLDDKIILNLDFDDKKGTLVIYAYIGEVPLANREAIYTQALEDNFFWNGTGGATLGLDKQSQSLMLVKTYTLPLQDFNSFEDELSNFVEIVDKWIVAIETASDTSKEVG